MTTYPNTTYCLVKQVENFLNLGTLTASTTPKKSQVEQFIHQAEDEIDRRTMHSWRARRVDLTYDLPAEQFARTRHIKMAIWPDGLIIPLQHRNIQTLDSTKGDVFTLRTGNSDINYIADKTEGYAGDYWLNRQNGVLHVKKRYAWTAVDTIKITYRYGEDTLTAINGTGNGTTATTISVDATTNWPYSGIAFGATSNGTMEAIYYRGLNGTQLLYCARAQEGTSVISLDNGDLIWVVPGDIQRACILLTCISIAHNDLFSINESLGEGAAYEGVSDRIRAWQREADEILARRQEMVRIL